MSIQERWQQLLKPFVRPRYQSLAQEQPNSTATGRKRTVYHLTLPRVLAASFLILAAFWVMSKVIRSQHQAQKVAFEPCDSRIDVEKVNGAKVEILSWSSSYQGRKVVLPVYVDDWRNADTEKNIEQVILHVHGRERNAWDAYKEVQAARNKSGAAQGSTLLLAPLFFNGLDKARFGWQGKASTGDVLVWKGNGWGDGSPNQYPYDDTSVSSFEALDAIIERFQDREIYPKLRRIVLSGHSLGGQLIHRYSVLGAADLPEGSQIDLYYVVMNPATYLYFTEDRAGPPSDDMNEYKYGFERLYEHIPKYLAIQGKPRQFFLRRLLQERNVHFLNGDSDNGTGDERPAAMAQGADRIQRAKNYHSHLEAMERASDISTRRWTVDWIQRTGHDGMAMTTSDASIKYLFAL